MSWYFNPQQNSVFQWEPDEDGGMPYPGYWTDSSDDAEYIPYEQATNDHYQYLTDAQKAQFNGELGWQAELQGIDYTNPWSWGSGQGTPNGRSDGTWMNPQTGQLEQSVMVEGGYRVPLSFAQAHGLQITGNAQADPDYGSDWLEENGWMVPLMIATAGSTGLIDAANASLAGTAGAGSAAGSTFGASDLAATAAADDAAMTAGLSASDLAGITAPASTGVNYGLGSAGTNLGLQTGATSVPAGLSDLATNGLGTGVSTGGVGLQTGAVSPVSGLGELSAGGLGTGVATGGVGLQTAATGAGLGVGTPATLDTLNAANAVGNAVNATPTPTANTSGGAPTNTGGGTNATNPLSALFPNATIPNILSALLQYGQMSGLGDDLQDIAQKALDASNPFNQPERQPFIGTNSPMGMVSLLQDPNGFLQNDPYINSAKQGIGEWAQANFAKSGNLPKSAILGSAQVGQTMADAYKDRLGLTSQLGGYTMFNPYAGSAYSSAASNAATQSAGALSGFGTLLGSNPTGNATANPNGSNPAGNIFNFLGSLTGS